MSNRTGRLFAFLILGMFLPTGCNRKKPDSSTAPEASTVAVAAASDLKFALEEIVTRFQESHPAVKVRVTYGSSGNFYSQLTQRAPFDLFLSADAVYPKRLVESGLGIPDSEFVYGIGRLVVWIPTSSNIASGPPGIQSLVSPSIRKIAIANPDHAPYGRAAVAALQKLGVYDSVKERLVRGENVAQAAQFVESGAADAGIIALSLALAPAMNDKGRYAEVPLDAYPKMEQGGVILKWASQPAAAREFRAFLLSPSGKSVLRRHGFFMPNE